MSLRPLLPTLALLCGCAAAPLSVFDRPAPAQTVRIVPLYNGVPEAPLAVPAETRIALATARQRVQAAQQATGGYQDRDGLLALAEQAAADGNNPRAQSLARQVSARAETAVEAKRTRDAAVLLKLLYDTTGLSDAQLDQLRAAEAQLVRGETQPALARLRSIKTSAQKPRDYTVRRGDTLSAIAARETVYGNSLLWPLLWAANRQTIPDPHRLRAGQTFQIRPSPTVDEVVAAIKTARQYPSRVRIGKVRTLSK